MRNSLVVGLLVLGGCSETVSAIGDGDTFPIPSQDQELMTTHPRVTRPDPEIEIEILPDDPVPPVPPEPPRALEACLPADAGPALALGADNLRLCFNRSGNLAEPADTCLWVARNGAIRVDAPAAETADAETTVTIATDEMSARLCRPGVDCVTLTPKLAGGQTIQQATLDGAGERVALLLQAGDNGAGTVTIHDAHDGHEIARGTRPWKRGKVSYEIGFVDSAILWIEYPGALEPGNAELWKTKRTQLKKRKRIGHRVSAWGPLGHDRFVFTGEDTRAEIWDIHRARRVAVVDEKQLVRGAAEHAAWRELDNSSEVVTGPSTFALLVHTPAAARIAFVDTSHGKPSSTIVSVPICSGED